MAVSSFSTLMTLSLEGDWLTKMAGPRGWLWLCDVCGIRKGYLTELLAYFAGLGHCIKGRLNECKGKRNNWEGRLY